MRLEREVIRSRVGRRILFLFVVCALLPVTLLAVVAFLQVRSQLRAKSLERLQQETNLIGKSSVDRMVALESGLAEVARRLAAGEEVRLTPTGEPAVAAAWTGMFTRLARRSPDGSLASLGGPSIPLLAFSEMESGFLRSGGSLIRVEEAGPSGFDLFMVRELGTGPADRTLLVAGIVPEFLWRTDSYLLAAGMQMIVTDDRGRVLLAAPPAALFLPVPLVEILRGQHTGDVTFTANGDRYLATFWSLPMGRYGAEPWYLVLGELRAQILAPIGSFMYYFSLIALVSLWVVLLLSIGQIRRNLVPLERLREGTRRIAERDFDSRVRITSGDEFEELGTSFNQMAVRLGQQFRVLNTIADIDRAVLSTLDEEQILETVFKRTLGIVPGKVLLVALFADEPEGETRIYVSEGPSGGYRLARQEALPRRLWDGLAGMPEVFWIREGRENHPFLAILDRPDLVSFLLLPIRHHDQLAGIMAIGCGPDDGLSEDDVRQARQLADQYAVALSNARLVRDLDNLSWGTLVALARAIDAKSHWTSGHSERVTDLALYIADAMGLDADQRDILRRGGLLHDLGKIGIPAEILDKAGRLTDEERSIMQRHPHLGARILEPIPVFRPLLPIVLQHHERFDGQGYPDGLRGEQIDLLARILMVADFYDALTSDRPYRPAWEQGHVIEIIRGEAGRQFDPEVVRVCLGVIDEWQALDSGASLEFDLTGEV